MYLVDTATEIAKNLIRNDPNMDPKLVAEIAFNVAKELNSKAHKEIEQYNNDHRDKIDINSVLLYRGLNAPRRPRPRGRLYR